MYCAFYLLPGSQADRDVCAVTYQAMMALTGLTFSTPLSRTSRPWQFCEKLNSSASPWTCRPNAAARHPESEAAGTVLECGFRGRKACLAG